MSTFLDNWLLRRAMSAPRGGGGDDVVIPSVYQRVEYIQGLGEPWIDTGYVPTPDTHVVIDVELIDGAKPNIFGNNAYYANTFCLCHWGVGPSVAFKYGNDGPTPAAGAIPYIFGEKQRYELSSSGGYIDGQEIVQFYHSSWTSDLNLLIFRISEIYEDTTAMKLYRCTISEDGQLVRDLIPCYRKSDGKPGMWDMVSWQFFTNAGSGADFTVGPDVVQPATKYIVFEDRAVEAICVANWSSDGIELTMQDAAAVTSLGNAFRGNTSITAFTELIYFTGLTDVSVWEFYGCDNLTKIGFPPNAGMFNLRFVPIEEMVVSNLAGYLTRTNASMESSPGIHLFSSDGGEITRIVIPQSISHISEYALAKHKWVEDISIHPMITNIGEGAFGSCVALLSLTVPGIASVPNSLCDGCSSLSRLTIGEGAETIGISVARYTNTIVVDLPSTITSIGTTAFAGSGNLTLLIKAANPPSIATNAFNLRSSVTIYVPYSADHSILDSYKAASGWSTYASQIYELNPDGTIPS